MLLRSRALNLRRFTNGYCRDIWLNPPWVHATLINCVSSLRHKRLVSGCCFGLIIMDQATTTLLFNGEVGERRKLPVSQESDEDRESLSKY